MKSFEGIVVRSDLSLVLDEYEDVPRRVFEELGHLLSHNVFLFGLGSSLFELPNLDIEVAALILILLNEDMMILEHLVEPLLLGQSNSSRERNKRLSILDVRCKVFVLECHMQFIQDEAAVSKFIMSKFITDKIVQSSQVQVVRL